MRSDLQLIAQEAEVAPQTIYNLIGAHDAIILAVIDELLDRLNVALKELNEAEGIDTSIEAVKIAAGLFIADLALYRKIVIRIPAAMFSGVRSRRNSIQIQIDAIRSAQTRGAIMSEADAAAIGQNIFFGYMGALYAWASCSIGDEAFVRAVEFSTLSALASFATPATRKVLKERLRRLVRRSR